MINPKANFVDKNKRNVNFAWKQKIPRIKVETCMGDLLKGGEKSGSTRTHACFTDSVENGSLLSYENTKSLSAEEL